MKKYFSLTPAQKVNAGYISWTRNFTYQSSKTGIGKDRQPYNKSPLLWKWYLQVVPFLRWLFNKPLKYESLLQKMLLLKANASQLNVSQWSKDKTKHFH